MIKATMLFMGNRWTPDSVIEIPSFRIPASIRKTCKDGYMKDVYKLVEDSVEEQTTESDPERMWVAQYEYSHCEYEA